MTQIFQEELIRSGYLHFPLRADESKATETRLLSKKELCGSVLFGAGSTMEWEKEGMGELSLTPEGMRITMPPRSGSWQGGESGDGHYAVFGSTRAVLRLRGEDWRAYNRICFRVKPECAGYHHPLIRIELRNDGTQKVPDEFMREGFHDINLRNHVWNDCVWEFPVLPRDKVTELAFTVIASGKELWGGDVESFTIGEARLGFVEDPDLIKGWACNPGMIACSTAGYWAEGAKTAVAARAEGRFELLAAEGGKTVYAAPVRPVQTEKGDFGLLDFTDFRTPGRYQIRMGDILTESFAIGGHVMEEAAWKVLNFLYCERCGYPVANSHSTCHTDLTATHDGLAIPYCGGWHDAGDLSQQTLQTAEVTHALLAAEKAVQDDPLLSRRIMEEARWGLDFVLRTRFGDGYRATSAGITRWTDCLQGNMDDEQARVHNRSFENFLISGVEAFAGAALEEEDADLAYKCVKTAKEDFLFAHERFRKIGMEQGIKMEHTYNASLSQYYAVAAWSAAEIYAATKEASFAEAAEAYAEKLLPCQETGESGLALKGFFYRDETHATIVHFNHQAREHLFIQALDSLCRNLPNSAGRGRWEDALRLYGGYLKALFAHAAPYGMLPAGIYCTDEADDRETFELLHRDTEYDRERQNYVDQVRAGIPVDETHFIRQFPVWFSFRGNTAVLLSQAKAASLIGRYFGDGKLLQIAREAMYWLGGKNPFAQSLIYGEGSNYAQQNAALAGEMVGEIPVGVQTLGNEDVPYWPMANNSTYKEVWTTSAGHWFWVLADLY